MKKIQVTLIRDLCLSVGGFLALVSCGNQTVKQKIERPEVEPVAKSEESAATGKNEIWSASTLALFSETNIMCVNCHSKDSNQSSWTGAADLESWRTNFVKIEERVSAKTMPPLQLSPPNRKKLELFVSSFKTELDKINMANKQAQSASTPLGPVPVSLFAKSSSFCIACHDLKSVFGWTGAGTEEGWKQNYAKIDTHVANGSMPPKALNPKDRSDLLAYIKSISP